MNRKAARGIKCDARGNKITPDIKVSWIIKKGKLVMVKE